MNSLTQEVGRILQALATLPGGRDLDVFVRRFPRHDPASPWTTHEEQRWHLEPAQMPATLPIPENAEEIVITLKGALTANHDKPELNHKLDELFGASCIGTEWEVRTAFTEPRDAAGDYELTVFQNTNSSWS